MRTGDTVLHKPSGEEWLVACVRGEYLSWCGWPEGEARLEDCELIKKCGDEAHWKLVREIAKVQNDHRGRWARWYLEQQPDPQGDYYLRSRVLTTQNAGEAPGVALELPKRAARVEG